MGGKTVISIPEIPSPTPNNRKNLIFKGHQKKGTTQFHGSKSCTNILGSFSQGELGSALRCHHGGHPPPPLQPKPLVPVGFEYLTLWPLRPHREGRCYSPIVPAQEGENHGCRQ